MGTGAVELGGVPRTVPPAERGGRPRSPTVWSRRSRPRRPVRPSARAAGRRAAARERRRPARQRARAGARGTRLPGRHRRPLRAGAEAGRRPGARPRGDVRTGGRRAGGAAASGRPPRHGGREDAMSGTPDTTAGPAVPTADGGATMGGASGGRRRFWSARRVPAGLLALVILAIAGLFLYDIAAVRAHRPGMSWRHGLARQLDERQLDDDVGADRRGRRRRAGPVAAGAGPHPGTAVRADDAPRPPRRPCRPRPGRGRHGAAGPGARGGRCAVGAGGGEAEEDGRAGGVALPRPGRRTGRPDRRAGSGDPGLGLARPSPLSLHVRRPGRKGR